MNAKQEAVLQWFATSMSMIAAAKGVPMMASPADYLRDIYRLSTIDGVRLIGSIFNEHIEIDLDDRLIRFMQSCDAMQTQKFTVGETKFPLLERKLFIDAFKANMKKYED